MCFWNRIVLKDGINEWRPGRLLAWSTDFEELRDGVGQFPVGLIEDTETGRVHSVPATLLSFSEAMPSVV